MKGKKRVMRVHVLMGVTSVALAMGACGSSSKDDTAGQNTTSISIGALADQTSSSATVLYAAAFNLALSQMNAGLSQAASNIRFNIVIKDSQTKPPVAEMVSTTMINEDKVKGIVTDSSGDTIQVNMLN